MQETTELSQAGWVKAREASRAAWLKWMQGKLQPGVSADPFGHIANALALVDARIEMLRELGEDGDGPERHLLQGVARPALTALVGVMQQCNAERGHAL